MADLTRGITFQDGERLTPAKLNNLVNLTTLGNIQTSDLAATFKTYTYGNVSPGVSLGNIWFDTTAGAEGLKYAWLSASNASLADWLYAYPRREAYYWATTTCSIGAPLFLGDQSEASAGRLFNVYDGMILPHATVQANSAGFGPAMVVAVESRTGAGPVKCAWSGRIPAWITDSNATLGDNLYVDPLAPTQFDTGAFSPLSKGLVAFWRFNAGSGVTQPDLSGNGNHLSNGNNPVPSAASNFGSDTCALFENDTTRYLVSAADPPLAGGDVHMAWGAWLYLNNKDSHMVWANKWKTSTSEREWQIGYRNDVDQMRILTSSDGIGNDAHNNAQTPPTQEWFFIFFWHDPDTNQIHSQLNDSVVTTNAHTGGIFNGTQFIRVGNDGIAADGRISWLAIWQGRNFNPFRERELVWSAGDGQPHIEAPGSQSRRSAIYGLALRDIATPASLPHDYLLWGAGPVHLDLYNSQT